MIKWSRYADMTMINIAREHSFDQKRGNRSMHQAMSRETDRVDKVLLMRVATDQRVGVRCGAIEPTGCRY